MMKISSRAGAIITPEKHEETPEKSELELPEVEKRYSPTKEAKEQILRMQRCHFYVHHQRERYIDLRKMKLTPSRSSQLSSLLLAENPDVPDFVLKMEEDAIVSSEFTPFLRSFLSEQLSISCDLSFAAFLVLNYSYSHGLNIEDSYLELFKLYCVKIVCETCKFSVDSNDRQKFVNLHNLNVLRSFQGSDSDIFDDSYNDKEFSIKSAESEASSASGDSSSDPFSFNEEDGDDTFINPFVTPNKVSIRNKCESDDMVNPFSFLAPTVHSTPIKSEETTKLCTHCGKDFRKLSNLKTHLGMMLPIYLGRMPFYLCRKPAEMQTAYVCISTLSS